MVGEDRESAEQVMRVRRDSERSEYTTIRREKAGGDRGGSGILRGGGGVAVGEERRSREIESQIAPVFNREWAAVAQ